MQTKSSASTPANNSRVRQFVTDKTAATSFYIEGMLAGHLPYDELQIFIWDTLEEWHQLHIDSHYICEREKVMWHLFHLVERWPESALRGNVFLRKQLQDGCSFLKQQGPMLTQCLGVRP